MLGFYGIECYEINGAKSMTARNTDLLAFKRAGREGPRVLLLSNVGITGLNIAEANILIILVSTRMSSRIVSKLIFFRTRPGPAKRTHS